MRCLSQRATLRKLGIGIAITLGASAIQVAPGHAASTPAPTRGGTLSVAITDFLVGFCPNDTNSNSAMMPIKQIAETLFEQRPDGQFVPFLAESASANADFTSWRIKTRTGITFSNGEKWDADALLINMKSSMGSLSGGGSATLDSAASKVNPEALLFHGAKYGGLAPVAWANAKKVFKVDDVTVQFDLKRPNSGFKELLYGSGRSFMRAPAMFTAANNPGTKLSDINYLCSKQIIGTGPFKMAIDGMSADKGKITITKNDTYWRVDPKTKAKLPYLDSAVFTTTKDAGVRVNGLKAGTTDMAWFTGNSESQQIVRAQKIASVKVTLSDADFYPQLWFSEDMAPFNKKSCRQAVSAGIDRATFASKRTSGLMKPMTSIVGTTNPGYTTKNFITYDVAAAKAYLATCLTDLGAAELAFTVPFDVAPQAQANGAELKSQLAAVGIKMTASAVDNSTIITNVFTGTRAQANWFSVLEGPGNQFNSLFVASTSNGYYNMAVDLYGSLPTLNVSRHKDLVFDELWFAARALSLGAAQNAKYQEAIAQWQGEAHSTSIMGVQFAVANTTKIQGVCSLKLVSGGAGRCVANHGIALAGVSKNKK